MADFYGCSSGVKADTSKFELFLPKREGFTEPIIKLKETDSKTFFRAGIHGLEIGLFYDILEYIDPSKPFGEGRVREVNLGEYNDRKWDTRLIYLTPEQKTRLIEDTGIPPKELEEICAIEKENASMLGTLLFNEYK